MLLEIQNLTKSFGRNLVLRGVSLTAETGTCVGVVGRKGAGKSTLFNLLTNILLPDSGQIVLDGQVLGETLPVAVKRRMGALVNQAYLVEQLTPEEYLQFVARIYDLPDAQPHIESLLAHLLKDYSAVRRKRLVSFSTGMKQKVAIASCLLHRPELLILDEPFNGLDVFSANSVLALLNSYRPQALTFISSHNLAHIEQVATYLTSHRRQRGEVLGHAGRLRADGGGGAGLASGLAVAPAGAAAAGGRRAAGPGAVGQLLPAKPVIKAIDFANMRNNTSGLMGVASVMLGAALYFLPWWARIALALLVAASAAWPVHAVLRNNGSLRRRLWQGIGA